MKQVFLICGADARWLNHERESLVERFVSREMRDENLLEIYATSSRDLRLDDTVSRIVSELATIPFLPDSRRVVVVHNLADFMGGGRRTSGKKAADKKTADGGGKKKRDSLGVLDHFVNHDLASTGNVLIFCSLIEHDRGRYLDNSGALYKMIQSSELGQIVLPPHRETDPLFLLTDAILARRAAEALRYFRAIYSGDTNTRIFGELLKAVRFLIQANLIGRYQAEGMTVERIASRYMSEERNLNLLKQGDTPQRKFMAAAGRFNLRELMVALERLLEIQRVLFPSAEDKHVPDGQMLVETFIVELCAGVMRKSA